MFDSFAVNTTFIIIIIKEVTRRTYIVNLKNWVQSNSYRINSQQYCISLNRIVSWVNCSGSSRHTGSCSHTVVAFLSTDNKLCIVHQHYCMSIVKEMISVRCLHQRSESNDVIVFDDCNL